MLRTVLGKPLNLLLPVMFALSADVSAAYQFQPQERWIIDTHEHFAVGGDMTGFLQTASALGIKQTVFLPTGAPPENRGCEANMKELLALQKEYPERIIAFCAVN